ncbi:hypothetical protein EDB92DRAFT_1605835 [Lactarius akahatsu]|uniref:Uncharacterized protein n=1 Tax=Lactarius akahatsu TaxID=416441 RepID=A0AAD4Q498_9AGAM|nr:hypothetical protein EDB92DRAFT_1605835 [Lactarius akahatsu]
MLGQHASYQASQDDSKHTTHYSCLFRKMSFIEIFAICITFLAVYGTVIYFRCLLPCYIIPNVSTLLNDVEQCLASAAETGAIPEDVNEYRANLETLASDLARMRLESHRSPGFFQQIWLAFRWCLTYRLYTLASQIRAVKMRIEIVMDEHHLALSTTP